MKITLIVVLILVMLFAVFQAYTQMSTSKIETQPYKVIRVEENFEIRYYPSATMATIASVATSYKDLGSSGFRVLAGYIFGGNAEKKQIAMTSPVHMDIADTGSSMSFVLPSAYHEDNLPKPDNIEIQISTSAPEYVAAIQFGGFASTERINQHKLLLESALIRNKLAYHGSFRFLGYNPPYQLFGRRNEVIVALDSNQIKQQIN